MLLFSIKMLCQNQISLCRNRDQRSIGTCRVFAKQKAFPKTKLPCSKHEVPIAMQFKGGCLRHLPSVGSGASLIVDKEYKHLHTTFGTLS